MVERRVWDAEVPSSSLGTPTNQDISNFQGKEVARSPRLRRGYARIFPYISELNRKGGQIQIQFFGKANGGSFQFFPLMILFRKNHWTKQVFRRGERYLSSFAKVQDLESRVKSQLWLVSFRMVSHVSILHKLG